MTWKRYDRISSWNLGAGVLSAFIYDYTHVIADIMAVSCILVALYLILNRPKELE